MYWDFTYIHCNLLVWGVVGGLFQVLLSGYHFNKNRLILVKWVVVFSHKFCSKSAFLVNYSTRYVTYNIFFSLGVSYCCQWRFLSQSLSSWWIFTRIWIEIEILLIPIWQQIGIFARKRKSYKKCKWKTNRHFLISFRNCDEVYSISKTGSYKE